MSGRDIQIQMSHTDYNSLKSMISVQLFQENTEHDFIVTSKAGSKLKTKIKKDAIITTQLMEFQINEQQNHELAALVTFYSGKNYKNFSVIYSETTKIFLND